MERNLLRYSYSTVLLLIVFSPITLFSQFSNSLSVTLKDSVVCESGSYFLYTSLDISPGKFAKGRLHLAITTPEGWKLVGESFDKEVHLSTQSTVVPLTFIRTRFTPSHWSKVVLIFADSTETLLLDTFFRIKAPAINDFQLLPVDEKYEIVDTSQVARISFFLKNTGTTSSVYQVSAKMASSTIFDRRTSPLMPGKDTLISFPVRITPLLKADKYRLQIQVTDSDGLVRGLPVEILHRFTNTKIHPTPYKQLPISLDWGSFLVDTKIHQYAEVQSTFSIKQGLARILFRTKTFGQLKTVEKNTFLLDFNHNKYAVSLGQLSEFSHFFAYGSGIQMVYKPISTFELGVKGIMHQKNTIYTNNNFQAFVRYQHNSIRFSNQLHLDLDRAKGIFGYLLFNDFKWASRSKWDLNFNVATGFEEFKKIRVYHSGDVGWSLAGLLNYHGKKWQVNAEFRYTQKSFPGLNKGFRMHQYELMNTCKKARYSLFYQYSFNSSSLLLDTIYLMDAFKYNIEKMGFRSLVTLKGKELNFSSGWLRQSGLMGAQVPNYLFGEGYFNWKKSLNYSFQLNTLAGYASKQVVDKPVWLINSSFDIKFKMAGIKGFYVQSPFLKDSSTKIFMHYTQTYLLSPYATFRLFRNLKTVWRYSFSRSLFDKKTIQSIGFSITYKNAKGNWQMQSMASIPVSSTISNRAVAASYPYVMLSIRRELNVPSFFKRQYHNLSVHVFEDLNANNQFDQGEKSVPRVRLKVNHADFETDLSGKIHLLNTDTGNYSIQLQPSRFSKGLIPVEPSTLIHFSKSKTYHFPIRRGYAINGKVSLELDPYSTRKFAPDNILIIVTAADGKRYTTITDSAGRFYMPMPVGQYTVSLNKDAFSSSLQPLQLSFFVNLNEETTGEVNFILRERKREIRMKSN